MTGKNISSKITRRKFIKQSAAVTAGLGLSGNIRAGSKIQSFSVKQFEPFSFVQMADPQLFMCGYEVTGERLQTAVTQLNGLMPHFVVVCGDLVHTTDINSSSKQQEADYYFGEFAKMNPAITLYNVSGNHDIGNTPTPESVQWYIPRFGPLWYSFVYRRNLFIVIESDLFKDPTYVRGLKTKQLNWLYDTLKSSMNKNFFHKFVFMHHPIYLSSPTEADEYSNLPLEIRSELLSMLHDYNVEMVFNGHTHSLRYVNDDGLEMLTNSSSGCPFDDHAGYRIINVTENAVTHQYYDYDEMPISLDYPLQA